MSAERERLRQRLLDLGFDVVRFASVADIPSDQMRAWLRAGHHADMDWMERTVEKRSSPNAVLEGVQSLILLGVNYWQPEGAFGYAPRWARYVRYLDYHDTIKSGLVAAGRVLEAEFGLTPADYRYYVDTGPVSERLWASRAGVGFIGKNAMLISREFGNGLFLGALLCRLDLEPDTPLLDASVDDAPEAGRLCGKCSRCLAACPTNAFPEPGVVDARRCVSYHTIENKGVIPRDIRPLIGDRIYGCDTCLEVCPWNRFAKAANTLLLEQRDHFSRLGITEILRLKPEGFASIFKGTAVKRLKLKGLLRNACIVAGNSGDHRLVADLLPLLRHEEPLVRAHAAWAMGRLGAFADLAAHYPSERDDLVLQEYDLAFADQVGK